MDADILSLAAAAAREAGRILRTRAGVLARESADRDTKLEADVLSETAILNVLGGKFPVLSEECGGRIDKDRPTWIIDPLDGTVNHSRGIPLTAVSIGLWHNGPILGVVYDFLRDEMFTGLVGQGAWLNVEPIRVSHTPSAGKAILFTGFPIASSFETETLTDFVRDIQQFKKVRLIGSAALSLAYVACGRGDAYRESGIRIWDVTAGLALVKAAGGTISFRGSDPLDVFAANAHISCNPAS